MKRLLMKKRSFKINIADIRQKKGGQKLSTAAFFIGFQVY